MRRCGNKAGHLSLLRNFVRELLAFKLEEKKEAAFQRGQGIGLNPNLAGWGAFDAWEGYEPTNDLESPKKVQQNKQPRMDVIPKASESPCKPPAPWMTFIKGKAVPLPTAAVAKPVNYPIGYAPVKLPCPIRLQRRHQVSRGKKLPDAVCKAERLELRLLQPQPRLQEHLLPDPKLVRALHKPAVLKKFGDNNLYRCPHCAALLLKSEATGPAAFSKCCAKGQVKMEQQFYELQRPFLRPAQRLQADEETHNQLDDNSKLLGCLLNDLIMGRHPLSNKFIKLVARFNHELAFGTATTEQKPVPGGYQPVKMNGMVTYRLSGLNPPRNSDGSTREELCGQVWTLNPDDAIELRKRRNLDAGLQLDNELLELLHRLMSHQQIGHPLSGLYFHLKRIYEEAKAQQVDSDGPPVDNLRIRLLTRGEVMQQNLPETHNIHPHQLQLPESVNQLAQLFFVDGDDGLPPTAEQGVLLKTRSGALTVLPWWDNWIDGALCPLLFPCGGKLHGVPTLNEEDVAWQYNPYVEEEEDILAEADDNGEGEQLLLDAEPKKAHHISRSQAARYMMQLRAPPRHAGPQQRNHWHDPHWLWWAPIPSCALAVSEFGDNNLYRCPHCAALLLKSEATGPAAFSKCCAKGQVKMEQQFYELQRPFLRPAQRLQADEETHNQLDDNSKLLGCLLNDLIMGRHPLSNKFIKLVARFNHELAFGTATTEQKPVPGGYQPVKMNGMVTYRLSGLNPPRNSDGSTREELCGQVWTLNPDDAIELRKRRNLDAGLQLDNELLELLHRLMSHQQIGHPLSGLYFHLKRIYEEAKAQQVDSDGPPVDNLRIRLLTRGEVMQQNLPETHNIHPHQLQLPESVNQLAQLFFVDGDDGLPPTAEQGVLLKTRSGALTVLPWWDNWIDGALCPLLFPCGGSVWKPALPLAKPDSAAPLPQQQLRQEFEELHGVPTLNEEDVAWQYNPYVEEEEDILAEADDNGEGEQLLLDAEPKKAHHISRSQAARYMMQLRAPPRHAGPQQRNHWHDPHWLWWARRLAEFFVCLLNNRIDRDKFANIKKNQPEQRSMLPAHLVRHFEREAQKQLDQQGQALGARAQLGRIFLAPRTLRGSRAYYQLQFADAMAICRQLGAPHLLITFTMNSAAKEFDTMLWEGQHWYNRPDISDRLFIDKSKEFLKDIVQRQVMGPVKAWFYSVEHQERGLPHIHLCLILDFALMQMSMEDYIDDYISAEIPELPHDGDRSHAAKLQRLFRRFILDNMYHTCSPRYCLVEGKCTKHFPRPFAEQTVIDDRVVGVQYRRRPPALSETERLQNPERYACAVSGKDNRFVVPHNRFLALKYRSHINVEWIQGDACIKYVLKYVMKGCQLAFVQIVNDTAATTAGNVIVNYDEFRQIRMARYQTPNEALLSIWGNKIVRKSHQVQHQRFHLPGQNRIVVPVGREEERAVEERERIEAEQDQLTPLTAYFTLNVTISPELAQEHTFLTICNAYWYDRQANQWKQRAQQRKNHLAMLEAASAGNPEHQALRMLLLHVRGPTGWADLYAGHTSFVDAAKALGLLEDSSIWVNTILEALSGLPTFRRRLNWTAVLLANSGLLDASFVLDQVLLDSRRLLTPRALLQNGLEAVRLYVLFRMELVFRLHGVVPGNFNSCCERLGLPAPVGFVMPPEDIIEAEFNAGDYGNRMWAQLMQGDDDQSDSATDGPMTTAQYAAMDAEFSPKLNDKQRNFLDAVCTSVHRRRDARLEPTKQLFMLTGDGGTGKTFAYNALIARLKSKMACRLLATASTGIAAQLLFEGATLHSKLRVPIDIDDDTTPMLDYESDSAKLLRALELLIIDEISISDKNVINYVDKLLRSIDMANHEKHFGGKIVVFGGDWKQLLPVAECSGALGVDNVNMAYWMSVKTTPWFTNGLVNIHRLTVNMRVTGNQENYRRTLKTWGTGVTVRTAATDDRRRPYVQLCPSLCLTSEDALIEFVFGDALKDPLANIEQLRGAAILCPLNKDTFKLNMELMARISNGVPTSAQLSNRIYTSVDTVDPDSPIDVLALNVAERYIENIYGKTPPGMPEHSLQLKVGAVMMVIKNISVAHGLCNGTRVQIIALGDNIITCRYIQGPRAGTDFKLYRHRFRFGGRGREATRHGAVKWTRLQFPLRPGFVITTHKSQGQTLARVGVHLSSSQCFAHGQFYVAMSRVRSSDDIRVLTSARSSNCVQNWVVQAVVDKEDIEEARQYAGPTAALQPPQPGPSALPALRPSPFEPTNSEHSDGSSDDNDDDQRPQQHRGRCLIPSPSLPSGQQIFPDQQPTTSVFFPPPVQQLSRRIHIDRGLYFEDVLGDGDCFYRAIVRHLFGYANGETELSENDAMAQEAAQRSLRRAVARAIQQRYHFAPEEERQRMHYAVFPVEGLSADDPDYQLRQLFDRAGIDDISTYAQRIFYPAANDPTAWANANFEGLYAADVLGRNIYVLDDVANASGRHQHWDLYILMPGFQQNRIEGLTHNDFLAILRTPRFVRRGEMQVVHQQNGPIEVQNPIIIRRQQNHFNAVHTSYRRHRTSTGLDRLSTVPAHQWSATEGAHQIRPSTSASHQLSPLPRVEVARQQQSPEHQRGLCRLRRKEVALHRPALLACLRLNVNNGKRLRKKKRWSEMMAAEGRRLLQQAEEAQNCERDRQAAEHQQLEAEQRREKLQQRRGRITQLWEPQTLLAMDSVQEQSLEQFESATAGLSRAQLKRLPYTVAGQPSGECCICKLEIRANNAITTLPCGHNNFHTNSLPHTKAQPSAAGV
uniref:ATP-dependent DNA helicase n=1 Tax=Globodera pallida TaxID=36090 RepID=A0A183C0L0_GLOPA